MSLSIRGKGGMNFCCRLLLLIAIYTVCDGQGRNERRKFKLRCDRRSSKGNSKRAFFQRFYCDLRESRGMKNDGSPQIGRASLPDSNCVDKMGNCLRYKSYCKTYPVVKKYCPQMCNACPICKDKHSQCGLALRQGYCGANDNRGAWAKKNCQKSCGICKTEEKKTIVNPEEGVKCGAAPLRKNQRGSATIVSGKEANQGFYPWQVAIYSNDEFLCGGSLIAKRYILSAAHCFQGSGGNTVEETELRITLGEHDRDYTIGVEQTVYVKKIIVHPDYRRAGTLNDIAILEIKEEAKLSDHIQIICLPKADEVLQEGSQCHVTGWGKQYAGGDATSRLFEISVPIVGRKQCKQVNDRPHRIVTEKMVCAGYYDGYTFKSACHGDSGGPLSCYRQGSWKLFGIVSWGSPTCNALESFNVFTNVRSYLTWIGRNTR